MTARSCAVLAALGLASSLAATTSALAAPVSSYTAKSDVKWVDVPGAPGVQTGSVQGDMNMGASHFFLKYPPGFVSPAHHHSADHYVVVLSGNLVLVTDGKDHAVPAGSYFAYTGKAPHVAKCQGAEPCVMFVDARDKWDLVPE